MMDTVKMAWYVRWGIRSSKTRFCRYLTFPFFCFEKSNNDYSYDALVTKLAHALRI